MIENRFRGKRVDNGEWVFGNVIGVDCSYVIAQNMFEWVENSGLQGGDWWHVIPATVGQFTGLRDKNGKEIYEGDIIKISTADRNHRIQEVIFKDGAFCGYSDKKACKYTYLDVLIRAHGVEVIGNIYDNPELLEVAK
ncbi:MAG: YopX family protein [Bacteroidales bacterium]|nr:YopX family protein [Bacteroidales bacterium]